MKKFIFLAALALMTSCGTTQYGRYSSHSTCRKPNCCKCQEDTWAGLLGSFIGDVIQGTMEAEKKKKTEEDNEIKTTKEK